jgi:predicted ATPase
MGAMTATTTQREEERLDERSKPPFLRRVRIKGYKSIAFCDVPLHPLTILVGRNGSGKSNFLDALAFLRDVMDTNLSDAVKRRGGWSSIVCRTAKVSGIEFEVEVEFEFLTYVSGSESSQVVKGSAVALYRLHLNAEGSTLPKITHEALEVRCQPELLQAGFEVVNGVIERWSSAPNKSSPLDLPRSLQLLDVVRTDRPLLGQIGSPPFIRLSDGLRYMGFYNFHPDSMRRLQKPSHGSLLEQDGSNLASAIEGLKEIKEESLGRIRDYLALINEDLKGFDVATYGEYETVCFDLKVATQTHPLRFDASSMSDGTLRALAALVAAFQIHLPTGPTVVGIEEPETALHPAAMRALVDAMDEATARTQVLLTTHSADLLSGRDITPGQVLVVRSWGGQTQITPVDPASREIIEKELYSLADLQRLDRLDLDEADVKRQAQMSNGVEGA